MPDLFRPVKDAVKQTPLWPILRPRRIHAYNLGAGRTGTTAVTEIFTESFRTGHEAHAPETVALIARYKSGTLSDEEIRERLLERDRRWRLEFESSPFLAPFAKHLADLFPEARFLLTVRPPKEWLRSNVDKCINSRRSQLSVNAEHFLQLRDLNYGPPPDEYRGPESVLERYNLHSLSGFLAYWARHYENVLQAIPEERLLVLRTRDLNQSVSRIAAFLEIPDDDLKEPPKKNVSSERHDLLAEVDETYIDKLIDRHCGTIVDHMEERLT